MAISHFGFKIWNTFWETVQGSKQKSQPVRIRPTPRNFDENFQTNLWKKMITSKYNQCWKKSFLYVLPTIKLLDDHEQHTLTCWQNKKVKDCLSSPSKGSVGRVHKPVRRYLGWRDRFDWMCQVREMIGWWMRRVSVNELLCILGNNCMIKGQIKFGGEKY